MKNPQQKQIVQLATDIKRHKELYYAGKPVISDAEFDSMVEILTKIDPTNKVLKEVGAEVVGGKKFKHNISCLSLNSIKTAENFGLWLSKLPSRDLIAETKLDGLTIALHYTDGKLVKGVTRGDGKVGEVIIHAPKISGVPTVLNKDVTVEVRGEGVCTAKYAKEVGAANPRNLAAGLIKRKDGTEVENVTFHAFQIIGTTNNTEVEDLEELAELGFTNVWWANIKSFDAVKEIYDDMLLKRLEWAETLYEMDGLAIKLNDKNLHRKLGDDGHVPKWATAWKFPSDQCETTVLNIVWSVGKTGRVVPVLEVKPVKLGGATIRNVTAFHAQFVKENKIGKGARILIERSCDVIPNIVSTIEGAKTVDVLTICPSCGNTLVDESVHILCNNLDCPSRVANRIQGWVKHMGIEFLGMTSQMKLMANGLCSISDLYTLPCSLYQKVLGKGAGLKIWKSIDDSKRTTFQQFIRSIGVEQLGEHASEAIAQRWNSIEGIIKNLVKTDIPGMADIKPYIVNQLKERFDEIKRIEECLIINIPEVSDTASTKLIGKKFLITGTLSKPRKEFEKMIIENGGLVASSVSKSLDFLIIGEKSGSKKTKAEKLGIELIDETRFLEMLI